MDMFWYIFSGACVITNSLWTLSLSQPKDEETANSTLMPVVDVEGLKLPSVFETNRPLQEHVQCLKDLEMREDDIIVMAYIKSGTHWLWEVTSMLTSGKAEYEKRSKLLTMVEATEIERIGEEPSPRVLNTHLPFRLLPRQIKEKRVKVIHIYRNVKDVFVSMYFFFRQVPEAEKITFESLENIFYTDNMPTGNYFRYLKEMDDYKKNNPDVPMFLVSYEDMKENTEKIIRDLAGFLGVKASPQLVKDIAQAVSLTKMREADKSKKHSHLPPVNCYRKGEVGDWKNYLTMAMSERLDAAMIQLESCDYHFRYSL